MAVTRFVENNGNFLEVENVGERASVAEVLVYSHLCPWLLYCI